MIEKAHEIYLDCFGYFSFWLTVFLYLALGACPRLESKIFIRLSTYIHAQT